MKKELKWIPIIYLVHKTIDMPFLNRHSKKQIQKNPALKKLDYENAEKAAKRFTRNPSTAFSFAEGTRFTNEKHLAQDSPYPNFLTPKIGALAIALKGMPQVNELVDFTVVYSSNKRSTWNFLCGEMSHARVEVTAYKIPSSLKDKTFEQEEEYRAEFKNFVEDIWNKDRVKRVYSDSIPRGYDTDTEIHAHHIYKGATGTWREILKEDDHDTMNERLSSELKRWGYEL